MATRDRRRNGEGTVRLRSDGRWEVRLRINGHMTAAYTKTEEEALEALHSLITTRDQGLAVPPKRLTVKRYLEDWIAGRAGKIGQRTFDGYKQLIDGHLVPGLGSIQLQKLGPRDIEALYDRLRVRKKQPLSAVTVRHIHEVLHRALRDAHRRELVPRNVADLVEVPAGRSRKFPTFTSAAEAQRFLAAASSHRLYALYALALTGMRQGELLGLCWDSVDLDAGMVTVRRSLQRTKAGPILGVPKTEQSNRVIVINDRLAAVLRQHRARQSAEKIRLGVHWLDTWGLVFTGAGGTPVSPSYLVKQLRLLLAEAKLDTAMRFHDLRHSSVTLLRSMGVGTTVASRRLGHSRESTTTDIYGRGDWFDMQVPAAIALDSLIPIVDVG